jgi:polygalacturonase
MKPLKLIFSIVFVLSSTVSFGQSCVSSNHIVLAGDVGATNMPTSIAPITAPFSLGNIAAPKFPSRKIFITQTGAKSGGKICTIAIQKAIDKISAKGGGTVIVPEGKWSTGRIVLKSNVNLRLERGAELHFSGYIKDYQPAVYTRNEGVELMSLGALIYANGAENVALTGEGTLFGPGKGCEIDSLEKNDVSLESFINRNTPTSKRVFDGMNGSRFFRPLFFGAINCKNVLVEGIKFRNGIFWTIVPIYCDGVIIRGVDVDSYGTPRGDGVDIESTRNVLIEYCSLNTTDDGFTIKAGRGLDGLRVNKPSENIIIRNCYVLHSAGGVTCGSETAGTLRNLYVHDCIFERTQNGLYFKTRRIRGGGADSLYYDCIKMINPKNAFYWDMLGSAQWAGELAKRLPERSVNELTPFYRNIQIKNIWVDSCQTFIRVKGIPESPLKNVTIENIKATSNVLIDMADVENFNMNNVEVKSKDKEVHIVNGKEVTFKNTNLN